MGYLESAFVGIAVAVSAAFVHHVDSATSSVRVCSFTLGITGSNLETGNDGWGVVVVGIVIGYAYVKGQNMGRVISSGRILRIDNLLLVRLVVFVDVAHQRSEVGHLIFVFTCAPFVSAGFCSFETSIHGNARRENETFFRSYVDIF